MEDHCLPKNVLYSELPRGVTRGAKGSPFPGRRITMGAEKSQNFTSTFFNSAFASEDLNFDHGGAKRASCPGRHLTSLRPWNYLTFLSRIDAPTTFQRRFETWLGCLQDCSRIIETKWSYGGKRRIEAQSHRSTITIWKIASGFMSITFPEVEKNTKLFRFCDPMARPMFVPMTIFVEYLNLNKNTVKGWNRWVDLPNYIYCIKTS